MVVVLDLLHFLLFSDRLHISVSFPPFGSCSPPCLLFLSCSYPDLVSLSQLVEFVITKNWIQYKHSAQILHSIDFFFKFTLEQMSYIQLNCIFIPIRLLVTFLGLTRVQSDNQKIIIKNLAPLHRFSVVDLISQLELS